MSRNLLRTECHGPVDLEESPRPITASEAGQYFEEYEGMLVANATCPHCRAKYLAWVDERPRLRNSLRRAPESGGIVDLSYRSTFDDEPGYDDLPEFEVQTIITYERTKRLKESFPAELSAKACFDWLPALDRFCGSGEDPDGKLLEHLATCKNCQAVVDWAVARGVELLRKVAQAMQGV